MFLESPFNLIFSVLCSPFTTETTGLTVEKLAEGSGKLFVATLFKSASASGVLIPEATPV